MSLTYVGKNGRVYQRRFDHDEARLRYQDGESVAAMAREFGVTESAIWQVVSESTRRCSQRATAAYLARNRVPCDNCGKPGVLLPHIGGKKGRGDGRALCHRCRSDEKIERLRFDLETAELVAVRCVSLDCANGERWQPPENFTNGTRFRWLREGGIHSHCRACQTRARREYRRAHPEVEAAAAARARARRREAAQAHGRSC